MWPLLSVTAFLEPEVGVECWVRTSVPTHPKGCCCQVYQGTTSPQTPHTPRDNFELLEFMAAQVHTFSALVTSFLNDCLKMVSSLL